MNYSEFPKVPKDKLQFVERDEAIHDVKLETKPVGYLKDALIRFCKNKGSIVAAFIILFLLLFSLVTPILSKYDMSDYDTFYKNMLPKSTFFSKLGFWDGIEKKEVKQFYYDYYSAIPGAVVETVKVEDVHNGFKASKLYTIKYDCYEGVGYTNDLIDPTSFEKIRQYEKETGIIVLQPMIDESKINMPGKENDANLWYLTDVKGIAQRDANGNYQNIFLEDSSSEYGDGYAHFIKKSENQYKVRYLYKEYYKYKHGFYASFTFGSDIQGYDIITRLAGGAKFSFILGISVALINIFNGVIYGAIEGYYGGAADLFMERIKDILGGVPFLVTTVLFNMYLSKHVGVVGAIIFAFVFTGWIGVSGRTRTQFYRFKGAEHVLASRTLGAKDRRLIFIHILPNSIGTLITSCILMIPSVVFQEAFLSYLGVIDLNSKTLTSVGSLLSSGQTVMADYPHIIFFPAVFISLMLLSFNIFGNGLRDAFNPSLRGAVE